MFDSGDKRKRICNFMVMSDDIDLVQYYHLELQYGVQSLLFSR
jgi:hypothetical protein